MIKFIDSNKTAKHSAYILKVNPNKSAENPIKAGPKIIPAKDILEMWEIIIGTGSSETLTTLL